MTELHRHGSLTVAPEDALVAVQVLGPVIDAAISAREGQVSPSARQMLRRWWSAHRSCSELGSEPGHSEQASSGVVVRSRREISRDEAAAMIGFSAEYVGRLCRDGRLEARKVGGRWLVDEYAVIALRDDREAGAA